MLIFRPLFDQESSTFTYLLGDLQSGEALLIDSRVRTRPARYGAVA